MNTRSIKKTYKAKHYRGPANNHCPHHQNKTIYTSQQTLLNVVLETQQKHGLKLSWYRCEHYNAWHLTKFANKH